MLLFFLSKFNNLKRWEIRVAFRSLYSRHSFEDFKTELADIADIQKWVNITKELSEIIIMGSPNDDNKYKSSKRGSHFLSGSWCSANYLHLVIHPNGKVTVCEQLYWNERFLIGGFNSLTYY